MNDAEYKTKAKEIHKRLIERGDIVDVYFFTAPALFNVKVVRIPHRNISDYFTLEGEGGQIHYVKNYDRMDIILKF